MKKYVNLFVFVFMIDACFSRGGKHRQSLQWVIKI